MFWSLLWHKLWCWCWVKRKIWHFNQFNQGNSSDIEQSIDSYAKNAKDQIFSAFSDDVTLLKFQKLVYSLIDNDLYREIFKKWKDFFKTFEAILRDTLKSLEKSYLDTKWYKSLTKVYRIYKKASESSSTIDYFCLQEKHWIVCNENFHRINFNEELAKKDPIFQMLKVISFLYTHKCRFEMIKNFSIHDITKPGLFRKEFYKVRSLNFLKL